MKTCLMMMLLLAAACSGLPEGVRQSLKMAGSNREGLERLLDEYRKDEADSLKFRAACFLIDNMKWHRSGQQVRQTDPQFEVFRHLADSTYYAMAGMLKDENRAGKDFGLELEQKKRFIGDSVQGYPFRDPVVCDSIFRDLQAIGHDFLKEHIENAFRMWRESPFARPLTFGEFCEFLLPYRSITPYEVDVPGSRLNGIFGKYLHNGTGGDIRDYVGRYNRAVRRQQEFQGICPIKEPTGLYDLFFEGKHDCGGIAAYGCNALRACGIPVAVELDAAYRDLANRHFHCAFLDSTRQWHAFNPESSLPGSNDWAPAVTLNTYRYYFSAQKDSPYFLKNRGEHVPGFMNNPCIRDVTAHLKEVHSVRLPFGCRTENRLVYLATFQNNEEGLFPVTWGVPDTTRHEVTFSNCLTGILYFPVYYEQDEFRAFGTPFYLEKDSTAAAGYRLCHLTADGEEKGELILTRKFPRKPNMVRLAEELVGSRFLASNDWDYSDSIVIHTIRKAPIPYLQEVVISNPKAWRYYQFLAPDAHPHANISMLEFITEKSYGYSNVLAPTPLPTLHPREIGRQKADRLRVKLLDAPSWDEMKWKAEYDGNMQTAPGGYKTINLRLNAPQVVTRIRFAPKNADNGIKPGDRFELMYWNDRCWTSLGTCEALHEYVAFGQVPLHGLYWLRNMDSGREELPFVVEDGKQKFIYYDVVDSPAG